MAEQNLVFNIYKEDGTSFNDIAIKSSTYTETVMSLDNNIEGYFYYPNNNLVFTYKEYITYKNVKYYLKIDEPPTIVRKGLVDDDGETAGMTKYTIKFFHPMVLLYNIPFTDVAVSSDESKYKSEDTTFSWIGTLTALVQKINKCLEGTLFTCQLQPNFVDNGAQSDVISFDNQMISDVLKTTYEKFKVPFVVDGYNIFFGTSSNEIYKGSETTPYIFKMGQGLGLKDNDRTPKNNTIITRIACYGSDSNIPNGYPKIAWTGNQTWNYTLNNDGSLPNSYPIIDSVINGVSTRVINHPFTRKYLMPTVYVDSVNKKVNPLATGYNPNIELVDYYDAVNDATHTYPNQINLSSPSYQKHQLEKIKPSIVGAKYNNQEIDIIKTVSWINDDGTAATNIDDGYNSTTGKYNQGYFKVLFYPLGFDLYAMAAVTSAMSVNPTSGACNGCKFELGVDWDVVKTNFYYTKPDGTIVFDPTNIYGNHRDYTKFPDSTNQSISVILKKDTSTFGTLMPNIYQHPIVGDKFVFIGIDLPQYYITQAQTNLDEGSKQYMLENNIAYFEYPFTFDEYFLTENQDVLAQIKSNSILRFEYGGENIALSIKELTIQWGDKALPEYKITLTDDVSISLNQLGQVTEGLSQLGSQVASIQASYDINITDELNKRVSKIYDDTVNGKITFKNDISVGGVLKVNSLTSGKIPYNTINGLADSPLYNDGTNITSTVNITAPTVSATTMNATTFIGKLQGNAATATKLKTPRTIWGQSFDGSGNVDGTLYISNGIIRNEGTQSLDGIPFHGVIMGHTGYDKWNFGEYGGQYNFYLSNFNTDNASLIARIDTNNNYLSGRLGIGTISPAYKLDVNGTFHASGAATLDSGLTVTGNILATGNVGIGTTTPQYKLDVNGTLHAAGAVTLSSTLTAAGLITANGGTHTTSLTATALSTLAATDILGDAQLSARVMSPDYASQTKGWGITRAGAADFRNIYADELRVQSFTADISQALAGSDYLTKSVSKLSANFVVPSVNSTVRIIVDDIEGMPATQCFSNGDYIRFRAFNRTSGLTIANVWGTVTLDTTFGTKGFSNGTQAYTFTCKATTGAGLTVFKGSEVLDYGTSGSGLIARTTLDAMGSPYEQIATWVNDPSNGNNYTVHARLGNLGGIANCSGYGLYTDNGFFTGKIIIGDLTKTTNYLSFDTTNGLQIKLGGTSVATTTDVNNSLTTANTNAQGYANTAQTNAINTASGDATTKANTAYNSAVTYTNSQITATNNSITAAVNGIQIGGTNLIVGSSTATVNSNWSTNGWSWNFSTYSDRIYKIIATNGWQTSKYKFDSSYSGKTLTISFYAKIISSETTATSDTRIMYSNETGNNPYQTGFFDMTGNTGTENMPVQDTWIYCKKTIVLNSDFQLGILVGCSPENTRLKTTVLIKDLKVEEGNKATTWSPAPEDVDASISTAQSTAIDTAATNAASLYVTQTAYSSQVTILQNSINAKVSQTDFNALGTRVSTSESTITQHSTDIASKVAQIDYTGNNIASLINQTATTIAINASKINLVGAVTFNSFNSDLQTSFNDKASISSVTTAQNAANAAQSSADSANSAIANIVSDNMLSANEKGGERDRWNVIASEKSGIDAQATTYGITTEKTSYDTAFQTLATYLNNGTAWSSGIPNWITDANLSVNTTVVGTTYRSKWQGYYDARTALLNAIYTKAKLLADNAQDDATNALTRNNTMAVKLGYTNYNALASAAALGHTLIDGGFINTQLIQAVAVVTNGLTANCITANMIASGAVTADKIYSGAVTTDKLYAGAVTAATIAAGAVTTDKLYVGAVTADKISANAITADKIAANAITADKIAANTITAGQIAANTITGDRINANSVSAAIATVISLDANRITTGFLSADRIAANSITFGKLVGTDITALGNVTAGSFNIGSGKFVVDANGNTTTVNMTAVNATISGTLNGVSGTFDYLSAVGSTGTLALGTYGMTFNNYDISQQGPIDGRSLRYYAANIRCRGSFGASSINMARVHDTVIDYYVNGDLNSYVRFNLQSNGVGGYYIHLYKTDSVGYSSVYGNAVLGDIYGFPVDLVIFDNSAVYQYELVRGNPNKKVTVINANNNFGGVYLNTNGDTNWQLPGGEVQTFINIRELTKPLISTSVHGAGWMLCGKYDNNWA